MSDQETNLEGALTHGTDTPDVDVTPEQESNVEHGKAIVTVRANMPFVHFGDENDIVELSPGLQSNGALLDSLRAMDGQEVDISYISGPTAFDRKVLSIESPLTPLHPELSGVIDATSAAVKKTLG